MTTKLISDKIILADRLFSGFVYLEDGIIAEVSGIDKEADLTIDAGESYISPGFIDLHTHGGGGSSFLTDSADEIVDGVNFHLEHGTTTVLPTFSACDIPTLRAGLSALKEAMISGRMLARVPGGHLEGPYLAPEMCGAQSTDFITAPIKEDYTSVLDDFGDCISRWTYAPERDAEDEFATALVNRGILPSIGHSAAKYDDVLSAKDAGARLITHLYSCTSTIVREGGFRKLGIIEAAYLLDDMYVEIIADGKHLPPELIKLILKIKGTDRVALITDSLPIAGTPGLTGSLSGVPYLVEDGVCKLADRSAFAGSIATADRLIRTLTDEVGEDIVSAVKMLTRVPADILGIDSGRIEEGAPADLVIFDEKVNVSRVIVGGKTVFQKN